VPDHINFYACLAKSAGCQAQLRPAKSMFQISTNHCFHNVDAKRDKFTRYGVVRTRGNDPVE
jgi:hypothetical protein